MIYENRYKTYSPVIVLLSHQDEKLLQISGDEIDIMIILANDAITVVKGILFFSDQYKTIELVFIWYQVLAIR